MNSLYDKEHRYTAEATSFSNEVDMALRPIFKKWAELGYSARELSHIAMASCWDQELDFILGFMPDKKVDDV